MGRINTANKYSCVCRSYTRECVLVRCQEIIGWCIEKKGVNYWDAKIPVQKLVREIKQLPPKRVKACNKTDGSERDNEKQMQMLW